MIACTHSLSFLMFPCSLLFTVCLLHYILFLVSFGSVQMSEKNGRVRVEVGPTSLSLSCYSTAFVSCQKLITRLHVYTYTPFCCNIYIYSD